MTKTRVIAVAVIVATVLAGRVGAQVVAAAVVPGSAMATQMLIEALVLACLYGAVAWRFVAAVRRQRLAGAVPARRLIPANVVTARPERHLRLVPAVMPNGTKRH